jgi:hypothetical protein
MQVFDCKSIFDYLINYNVVVVRNVNKIMKVKNSNSHRDLTGLPEVIINIVK